ncbi:MAG: flagellar biosynthesis anti-sigma factor FlgM [Sulfuricella sp.]|nr:flagellar biosynthesis anti-sigma factor FlgM [Gammaproteobacteria bacterium]
MKIDASVKSPASTGIKEATPRTSKAGTGTAAAVPQKNPSPQDNVQITTLSSQLHAMENSMDNVPVVDTARVDAIKQAISEGRFKVNPEVIADRLLATIQDLVRNQKG